MPPGFRTPFPYSKFDAQKDMKKANREATNAKARQVLPVLTLFAALGLFVSVEIIVLLLLMFRSNVFMHVNWLSDFTTRLLLPLPG